MRIYDHKSLLDLNTFGVEVFASKYCEVTTLEDLHVLVKSDVFASNERLILGGGSNVLFTENFTGLVVKNCIQGMEITKEEEGHIWVKVGAGMVWHDFVIDCIKNNRGGVENLSLIPGTVGAAPMQNIGAYGVEVKDVVASLEAFHWQTGKLESFDNTSCEFGYRDSIFKRSAKGQYIITSVTFKLTKVRHHLNTTYGAIKGILDEKGISTPTIANISDAVIQIRQSKLPDPKQIGNAGSFFKNPVVDKADFEGLKAEFSEIPCYALSDGRYKIPAGWLIEQCGWKGRRIGNIGVHRHQALVLVNYGKGKGIDIKELALKIQQSVVDKFGIELSPEINFIPDWS